MWPPVSVLRQLHWLPVHQRTKVKPTSSKLHSLASQYLVDDCQSVVTGRRQLHAIVRHCYTCMCHWCWTNAERFSFCGMMCLVALSYCDQRDTGNWRRLYRHSVGVHQNSSYLLYYLYANSVGIITL